MPIPLEYEGMELEIPPEVYSPAEDTDLCIAFLSDWMKNAIIKSNRFSVLEIGCGPGTLSIYVAKKMFESGYPISLVGIDINPIAIEYAIKNARNNNVLQFCKFLQGDLFSPLKPNQVPFDLIIFNPPYLPSEEETINDLNRQSIDHSWDGGPQGDEVTIKFLEQLPPYMKQHGEFLFVGSSCVDQSRIQHTLESHHLKMLEVRKKHIFFEDILLYHGKKE